MTKTRNKLLGDIVVASGGVITDPNNRNSLWQDWLNAVETPPLEQRYFIDLDPVLNNHYLLANSITFSGDFEVSFCFSTTVTGGLAMIIGYSSSTNYFVSVDGVTGKVRLRLNSFKEILGLAVVNDGKLHHGVLSVVGGDASLIMDGIADGSVSGVTPSSTFDYIGRNSTGVYFNGIIANVKFTDLSGPTVTTTFKLDRPTGNTEQSLENNNTATYIGIPETNREEYTLIDGSWIGQELVVNGDFDTDTDWVKGAGWSISGGEAMHNGGFGNLQQSGVVEAALIYQVNTSLTTVSGGSCIVDIGGTPVNVPEGVSSLVISDSSGTTISYGAGSFVGSIGSTSVKRILEVA